VFFFCDAGFLSTGDSNAPGNYAILDQVAALHWIKENIGSFSGDPNSVTLLGHGYGASLVNLLLVSPVTRGNVVRYVS
jgi:carboxylesterase type B